jgi:hypothetical protein
VYVCKGPDRVSEGLSRKAWIQQLQLLGAEAASRDCQQLSLENGK